jgi:uncharacterized membrane protein YecN with MAPEG domain
MPYLTPTEWVAVYAGLNILILLVLAYRTVAARRANKISLGDGGNPAMQRAIRAHANATEYIPAGLAGLILLAWLPETPQWLLHAGGLALTIGRLTHGVGLSMGEINVGRMVGTALTWTSFLLMGAGLVIVPLMQAG